jgi:hypothetical protein
MTSSKFTIEDYEELNRIFTGGDISKCSKGELEKFAVMLSRPRANEKFGTSNFPEICETVRMLILVRMSEESNAQANRVSRIAIIVAFVALLLSGVQVVFSLYNRSYPLATEMYVSKPIEVMLAKPLLKTNEDPKTFQIQQTNSKVVKSADESKKESNDQPLRQKEKESSPPQTIINKVVRENCYRDRDAHH